MGPGEQLTQVGLEGLVRARCLGSQAQAGPAAIPERHRLHRLAPRPQSETRREEVRAEAGPWAFCPCRSGLSI